MTCRYETLRAWYDRAGGLELGDSGLPAIASACYTVGGEGPECLARHQRPKFRDSLHVKNRRVRSFGRCTFWRQPSKDEVRLSPHLLKNLTRGSVIDTVYTEHPKGVTTSMTGMTACYMLLHGSWTRRDPNVRHANSAEGLAIVCTANTGGFAVLGGAHSGDNHQKMR